MPLLLFVWVSLVGCAPCKGEACLDAAARTSGMEALTLLDAGCADQVVAACGEAARIREFGDGVPIGHGHGLGPAT